MRRHFVAETIELADVRRKVIWVSGGCFALAAMLLAWGFRPVAKPEPSLYSEPPMIQAGEWVTRPNGDKVCRIPLTILPGGLGEPSFWLRGLCKDWQIEPPAKNSPVTAAQDYIKVFAGRQRLHVGDRWVP